MLDSQMNTFEQATHPTKVHAYGEIWYEGRADLYFATGTTGHKAPFGKAKGVNAKEYQECVFERCFKPAVRWGTEEGWLMQNGAKPDTAKPTKRVLNEWAPGKWIQDWLANSSDMNPIENVLAILKAKVKVQRYAIMAEFEDAVRREWWAIPQRTIQRCIGSKHI